MVPVRRTLFIIALLQTHLIGLTDAFAIRNNHQCWLAKTKETFKLSDLQYLEARLQCRDFECERLVLDAATGSSLLRLSGKHLQDNDDSKLPSSLKRCDSIATILAEGKTVEELVNRIRHDGEFHNHEWDPHASWTLSYLQMNDVGDTRVKERSYASKSLLNCIAQAIHIPATLNPANATDRLQVVHTDKGLFLTRQLRSETQEACQPLVDRKKWNQRPFQYSSAINPTVSEVLVTLVFDLVEQQFEKCPQDIAFLDPTCGSGTFLAFAVARGANGVQGWDTSTACVKGATRNIEFMFGKDIRNRCKISLHDATRELKDRSRRFDCAIANLPWGQNSMLYYNENVRILESLPNSLWFRAPCAFVTKGAELQKDMKRLGYHVLGTAHIPLQNLTLPSSNKASGKEKGSDHTKNKRDEICVVTVTLAPK